MTMDAVFKALADPSRRRLLDRLNERNGQSLRELGDGLGMARQSVTKHLAVLEAAGVVTTTRRCTSSTRRPSTTSPTAGSTATTASAPGRSPTSSERWRTPR
jgi:DNA-binding transcriptional ArsR family regulator